MKTIMIIAAALLVTANVNAQSETKQDIKHGVKKGAHAVKEAGKDVGHETAELSSKAYNSVRDEKLNDKVGPNGQAVYISGNEEYYYIDEKGKRVYLSKDELKVKE